MSREVYTATIETGQLPVYKLHTLPAPLEDEVTVKVLAVGFSHLVKNRANGSHYSAGSEGERLIGVDGVGEVDGELVFFTTFSPTAGAYGEYINAKKNSVIPITGFKDRATVVADLAGLFNSGLSAFFAFSRIPGGIKGLTVGILGVAGAGGNLAAQIAKKNFGAAKVVGIARGKARLEKLKADGIIDDFVATDEETSDEDLKAKLGKLNVVLDYVGGKPTEEYIEKIGRAKEVASDALWWVVIGSVAGGANISLANPIFRSRNFFVLGSGIGPQDQKATGALIKQIVAALSTGEISFPLEKIPLKDIAKVWEQSPLVDGKRRYFSLE